MKKINFYLKIMQLKYLLATIGILVGLQASLTAQTTQNSLISIAPNYNRVTTSSIQGLPFGLQPMLGGDYYGQSAEYTHNAMQDVNGNLLFFTVDDFVYDKDGYRIGNLYNNLGNITVKGTAEMVFVPDPANCDRYYIIAAARDGAPTVGSTTFPFYGILDLSQPNPNYPSRFGALESLGGETASSIGDITSGFQNFDVKTKGVFIAASKLRDDNSRFVFISNSTGIFRYKIDNSGFNYDNYYLPFNPLVTGGADGFVRGEMELVELGGGNYRIAVGTIYYNSNTATLNSRLGVYTADLDNTGTLIPTTDEVLEFDLQGGPALAFVHGLEFSPNGDILYITHDASSLFPNPIEFYDFNNTGQGVQPLSLTNDFDFMSSQIELGKDGKLYFATSDRLATLSNSNTPNSAIWNDAAQPITYSANYEEVPGFPYHLKTYILPDQIDGMDYTAHFNANVECCLANNFYHKPYNPGVITSPVSETWTTGGFNPFGSSGEVLISDNLTIPAGVTVTIQGMIFKFAPGAKVIVERGTGSLPGGKLILDNTLFSSDNRCDIQAMWQGVQVYGHSNQNQTPSFNGQQGQLILRNRSKIEHAMKGAVAVKINQNQNYPYNFTSYDFNYTGGIIQASNSSFYNNRQDIEFRSYIAPNGINNQSRFSKCEFTTYGLLNNTALYPQYHVFMHNIVGVGFYGNKFRNMTPELYDYWRQGQGIYSFDAKYSVNAACNSLSLPCSSFEPNEFENLYFGIRAITMNELRTIKVDRNDFVNNYFGIYLQGSDMATITRNDFEVYRSAAPNLTFATYGLYLNRSTGYQVEENTFTEFNDPAVSANGNTHGIIVDNSGISDNEIYKNDFFDINIGGQSQRINSVAYNPGASNPNNVGLRWKCNDFTNEIFEADLAVTSGRIAYQQGYCVSPVLDPLNAVRSPAGNRFSHSTFDPQNDISANNSVLQFNYAHHVDLVTTPLYYNTTIVAPQDCFNNANQVYYDNARSCPSKINDQGILSDGPAILSQINGLKVEIANKESLIDGGNTSLLLNTIATESDRKVKDALIVASPYLSDEVLLAYLADNSNAGYIEQVVLSNSPVSGAVMYELNKMGLPKGTMTQITNAQSGISVMTYLYNEIGFAKSERNGLVNERIRLFLNDTISPNPLDSVALILKDENITFPRKQLCSSSSSCYMVINDPNAEQQIVHVDHDHSNTNHDESQFLPIVESIESTSRSSLRRVGENNFADVEQTEEQSLLTIYPNPSNGVNKVILELELTEGKTIENATIEVYGITGQLVSSLQFDDNTNRVFIQPDQIKSGMYLIKLYNNGQLCETKKLLINY